MYLLSKTEFTINLQFDLNGLHGGGETKLPSHFAQFEQVKVVTFADFYCLHIRNMQGSIDFR